MNKNSLGRCGSTSNNLQCQKKLYVSSTGELWEHAGGHTYTTDEVWQTISRDHVDSTALLSGAPTKSHLASECDGSYSYCAWRFV